ncbi:hypothetical protein AAC387_Pa10g0417 [Persea americana]
MNLNAKASSLTRKIEAMEMERNKQAVIVCRICDYDTHSSEDCPTTPTFKEVLQEHTSATNAYQSPFNNQVAFQKEERASIGQLNNALQIREKGSFPAQPHPNPKGQYEVANAGPSSSKEHVQVVTTLQSGKEIMKNDPKIGKEPGSSDKKVSKNKFESKEVLEKVGDDKEKEPEIS